MGLLHSIVASGAGPAALICRLTNRCRVAIKDRSRRLVDLLTTYYNAVNASAMREIAVALLASDQPQPEKLCYNGL